MAPMNAPAKSRFSTSIMTLLVCRSKCDHSFWHLSPVCTMTPERQTVKTAKNLLKESHNDGRNRCWLKYRFSIISLKFRPSISVTKTKIPCGPLFKMIKKLNNSRVTRMLCCGLAIGFLQNSQLIDVLFTEFPGIRIPFQRLSIANVVKIIENFLKKSSEQRHRATEVSPWVRFVEETRWRKIYRVKNWMEIQS